MIELEDIKRRAWALARFKIMLMPAGIVVCEQSWDYDYSFGVVCTKGDKHQMFKLDCLEVIYGDKTHMVPIDEDDPESELVEQHEVTGSRRVGLLVGNDWQQKVYDAIKFTKETL